MFNAPTTLGPRSLHQLVHINNKVTLLTMKFKKQRTGIIEAKYGTKCNWTLLCSTWNCLGWKPTLQPSAALPWAFHQQFKILRYMSKVAFIRWMLDYTILLLLYLVDFQQKSLKSWQRFVNSDLIFHGRWQRLTIKWPLAGLLLFAIKINKKHMEKVMNVG